MPISFLLQKKKGNNTALFNKILGTLSAVKPDENQETKANNTNESQEVSLFEESTATGTCAETIDAPASETGDTAAVKDMKQ